jgi:hypothetical protein
MNRIVSIVSKASVMLLPVAVAVGAATSENALAQAVYVAPPAPPAAYVAVNPPEYYQGHAAYLYNGNWYYRDGHGAWNYYRHEPGYLHGRRAHWDARRQYHYKH